MRLRGFFLTASSVAMFIATSAAAETPKINCPAGQVCQAKSSLPKGVSPAPRTTTGSGSVGNAGKGVGASAGQGLPRTKGTDLTPVTRTVTVGTIGDAQQRQQGKGTPTDLSRARRGATSPDAADAQLQGIQDRVGSKNRSNNAGSSYRQSITPGGLPSRGSLVGDGGGSKDKSTLTGGRDGGNQVSIQRSEDENGYGHIDRTVKDSGGRVIQHDSTMIGSDGRYVYMVNSILGEDGNWHHYFSESRDAGRTWTSAGDEQVTVGPNPRPGPAPHPTRNIDPDAPAVSGAVTCPPVVRNCGAPAMIQVWRDYRSGRAGRTGPGARPGDSGGTPVPRLNQNRMGNVVNPNPVEPPPSGGNMPPPGVPNPDKVNPGPGVH